MHDHQAEGGFSEDEQRRKMLGYVPLLLLFLRRNQVGVKQTARTKGFFLLLLLLHSVLEQNALVSKNHGRGTFFFLRGHLLLNTPKNCSRSAPWGVQKTRFIIFNLLIFFKICDLTRGTRAFYIQLLLFLL